VNLPPNQELAAPHKWPVVGERAPRADDSPWTITVTGLVEREVTWTLDELLARPLEARTIDIHCVTRWSKPGARFEGIPLAALLAEAGPLPEAKFLSFVARSERHHSTSLPLADALALEALVAFRYEGQPLEPIHGGPVRTVVPGRYFYKSLKWLERIEVLSADRLGYWEGEAGYHNVADPWREERYIASSLDRRLALQLISTRDFSHRDLLSIAAAHLDLAGLNAQGALLRNASFRETNLAGADFTDANLSNADLTRANLRGARLLRTDAEGADFRHADLRGADFTNASLFGATFDGASIDATTRFTAESLTALSPGQQEYVKARTDAEGV
jgi:DMSO/TMAO reductase YedYZ molybdopterin-dependent catalytic subunit